MTRPVVARTTPISTRDAKPLWKMTETSLSTDESVLSPHSGSWLFRLIAAALAGVLVWWHHELSEALQAAGAYSTYNVLFDADCNIRLENFSMGFGADAVSLRHPNLTLLVHGLVRSLAIVGQLMGLLPEGSSIEFRLSAAAWVLPVCSGIQFFALALTFRALGMAVALALGCAAVAAMSFSQLVFGSLIDHFAISGCLLAIAVLLTVSWVRRAEVTDDRTVRRLPWIAVVTAAIAITSVNWVACLLFFAGAGFRLGIGFRKLVVEGSLILFAAIVLNGAGIGLMAAIQGLTKEIELASTSEFADRYVTNDPLERAWQYPQALSDTFAPAALMARPNPVAVQAGMPEMPQISVASAPEEGRAWQALGWACLGLAAFGAVCGLVGRRVRFMAWPALALVGINGVMLAMWGSELFLYSQQWLVPLSVLVALGIRRVSGAAHGDPAPSQWRTVALSVVLWGMAAALGYHSAMLLQSIGGLIGSH